MKRQSRIGIGPESRGLAPQSFQKRIYASLGTLEFVGWYVVFHPIRVTSARLHNNVEAKLHRSSRKSPSLFSKKTLPSRLFGKPNTHVDNTSRLDSTGLD